MEAVPRLPMLCCDLKVSPNNTDFGPVLKKYIRDHYHEDPESYSKEIKELELLRQNAIKAPLDFTGCSILKKYYSQLQKLQNRFPMTDDGAACVPFMWTDIYSGVAYNITDIEYEEACILYNIGALHSKLGTMDSRINAEGIKIACTHFQCAAFAFQHLRDTYPQPKGSDMSHDLLTFFINVMLAQAQECILEKSMLDNRKSSITAKIAAQVVDYYKCASGIMVSGSPSTDTGSILDIVGSKAYKGWKKFIELKMEYYTSISHLYMGNQTEENEKWGERVAWFQSAYDHLMEAFKIAKKLDRDDINEALTFTNDVIGGKHTSSKKENDFVYHDKVPAISSLPELKGASLVKGIPFNSSDPEVSGPDIFGRLVPMEAHETSSLYSEEKAKILRSVVSRVEAKDEELMAYLSSLQLENATSFDDEDTVSQELIEKCAALSVRPTAISDLTSIINELLDVSKDVETSLKASVALLTEEQQKELKHQETFGKRGPSMITVELKKECSKYEEAHKKAVESNNTLQTAVSIHIGNLTKLSAPLDEIIESLPSACSIKTPENVKIMDEFNHLVNKVDEMRKQRQFLEIQLRDALLKDDITKHLVTLNKNDDIQQTFSEQLKKHNETLTYIDQNLTAQDNILCALTEANAHYADTRKALSEIRLRREEMVKTVINSYDAYEDLMEKAKKGLEFYKKLQSNVARLLSRIKSVTKVQNEERTQRAEAELRKGGRVPGLPNVPQEQYVPKLKDYLPYLNKRGSGVAPTPAVPFNAYTALQPNAAPSHPTFLPESVRQVTLGGPASAHFDRNLKPSPIDNTKSDENFDVSSIGVRPTPVGSEQTSVPAMCTTTLSSIGMGQMSSYAAGQPWNSMIFPSTNSLSNIPETPLHYSTQAVMNQCVNQQPVTSNAVGPISSDPGNNISYNYSSHFRQVPNSAVSLSQNFAPHSSYQASTVNIRGMQTTFLPSPSITNSVCSLGSVSDQKFSDSKPANPAGSGYVTNSAIPTGGYYSTGSFPSDSILSAASTQSCGSISLANSAVFPNNAYQPGSSIQLSSVHQSSLSQPSSSVYQVTSPVPSKSLYPSNVPIQRSLQPPNSVQFSALNTFSESTNYPTSVLQSSATLPAVLQNYPVSSQNILSDNCATSFSGSVDKNVSAGISTTSTTIMNHSYNLPYSVPQQGALMLSSAIAAQQNQEWHSNSMHSTSYDMQPSLYNVGTPSNVQYNSPVCSPQYYHGSGNSIQAKQACVTASMDTRTSTFNSLNPYALSDSNADYYSQQNTYSYAPTSSTKASNITAVHESAQLQTNIGTSVIHQPQLNASSTQFGSISGYPASSQNISVYNSVPSSLPYPVDSTNVYHNSTYTSSINKIPNTSLVSNASVASTIQNVLSVSGSPLSCISNPCHHVTSDHPIEYTYERFADNSTTNVAYGSSPNIPNQQLQAPMEPKSILSSQHALPISSSSSQINDELENSVKETLPNSSSADLQTNVPRDFITPPPDTAVNLECEKEKNSILQPKVIDLKAIAQLKEKDSNHLAKDPLDDPSVCAKFVSEVEKYEKLVDGLVRKSLNGTTPLDQKWKEFIDIQDKESRKMSISVARCCPLKNRFPDVMPYDNYRVKLTSAKDDYINASYLKDICSNCPVFVITQAPLPSTFYDFWLMVWEQQVETLVCLLSDSELKNHVYYPKEKGQVLTYGTYEISLHSIKEKNSFVERMINVTHSKNRTSRVVVHLQFTEWPISGVPNSPATILQFITETLSYYKQQRNLMRPIVVHCSAGIGRSGCFCLITAMVSEMNNGHGPRDVTQVLASVCQQRKFLIQEKDQLKFCYDTILYYAQDLLMRRGILTTRASFDNKLPGTANTSSHVRHPSEDFILGGGLAKLQSGIAKLGLSSDSSEMKTSEPEIKDTAQNPLISETFIAVQNEDVKDIDTSDNKSKETIKVYKEQLDNTESCTSRKDSIDKPLPSITSLLDPSNFTLDPANSPAKRKITKENFTASKGNLSSSSSDGADPLNQLDPLWSLKK